MTTPHRLLVLLVVIAAFALRLVAVDSLPPGLYHDEAYYGIDATGVLAGDRHLYFPANNGREPLFIYLVAGMIGILGPTPAAVRLVSVFAGTAGTAAAFAMATGLYGRRVGLLTAALFAVAPWPVILGRVGFRVGLLPLVLALAVAATTRGARRSSRRWIAFGGALAGLTLYTYTAARLLPVAIAAWGLWWLWARRARQSAPGSTGGTPAPVPDQPDDRPVMHPPASHLAAVWLAAALLVAAPLLVAFARDPGATLGRAGQVSVFAPEIHHGDLAGALARNLGGTLGMVFVRGDFIPRHNIPNRPVLGLLGGALWLAGLGLMLWRRRPADVLIAVWIAVMLIPTLLAENAPHFLRAAGSLPALLVPPAVAVAAVAERARGSPRAARLASALAALLALLLVGGELAATLGYARAAGAPGPTRDTLAFAFEGAAVDLAREVNTALGSGWRGGWSSGPAARSEEAGTGEGGAATAGAVWLDRRLRDGWAAVPFLVDVDRVKLNDGYDPILDVGPGVAFLQPEGLEPEHVWAEHVPGLRIDFGDGPLARGDLESTARPLYIRIDGRPAPPIAPPRARFANGLVLLGAVPVARQPSAGGERLILGTVWGIDRAPDAEPTVFFQVLEGDRVVAASDAPLGRDLFPVAQWKPGDQVVERRVIDVPGGYDPTRHRLVAGAYTWPSVERIPVVAEDGAVVGDHVVLAGGPK